MGRECSYPEKSVTPQRPRSLNARKSSDAPYRPTITEVGASTADVTALGLPRTSANRQDAELVDPSTSQSWLPFPAEQQQQGASIDVLRDETFFLDDDLFTFGDALTPNFGPVEWFDLLAEDAINNMQEQPQGNRWNFDINSLSRRQSRRPSFAPDLVDGTFQDASAQSVSVVYKPWNTESSIELKQDDVIYFEHFINVVAPILDLFDPGKHFARVVPHLALRNVGLLKALLAVGACHMVVLQHQSSVSSELHALTSPITPASTSSSPSNINRTAEQYYYETLQYLSQNLLHEAYTTSHEILTTATMISIYEVRLAGTGRSRTVR